MTFQITFIFISAYIFEMRYYGHYLHFLDYFPHLCHHVYYKVSAVVRSSLLQVVGMSNLTPELTVLVPRAMFNGCQLSVISC